MVDEPEQDPDAPTVPIPFGMPLQQWVESAAHSLAVRPVLGPALSAPQIADGELVAIHAVRSAHGQVVTYAVARENWLAGELVEVLIDATLPGSSAASLAIQRLTEGAIIGAACLRLRTDSAFEMLDLGPSVTAGWTLDGCVTSLYENHVRAVLDLPLGAPRLRGRAVATRRVGAAPAMHAALRHCFARDPELRVHLYGTSPARGMTIGHVTVVADEVDDAVRRARHAADYLTGDIEE